MKTIVKSFKELNTMELYSILQLRSAVFVVEQQCIYQDMDGYDMKALHIMGHKEKKLIAYTRIFRPGEYADKASISRVLVENTEREHGYGREIMKAAIAAIQEHFETTSIELSAQTYLKKFYTSLGFRETGVEYLEDGIPHTRMIKK